MNIFVKLLISLVIAGIAYAIIFFVPGMDAPLPLFLAFAITAGLSALLGGGKSSSTLGHRAERDFTSGTEREEGVVKWFNSSKGFGFIIRDDGEEIFVHYRSIIGADEGRRSLRDGQQVSYVVTDSDKGPQAEEVEGL